MNLLDLTLETPQENLALDDALLEAAESGTGTGEVLRLWESPQHVVVLGRSSDPEREVNLDACRRQGIPVLRRASGGTTVVIGPGCLMYAVVLSYQSHPQLKMIEAAHRYVLERLRRAIELQVAGVAPAGTSDLTLNLQKFSGNSLRCRQRHFLYHGTVIYDFQTSIMSRYLGTPARQPAYRKGRPHQDFVTNLWLDPITLRYDLAAVWEATTPCEEWPQTQTARLVGERYSQQKWSVLA